MLSGLTRTEARTLVRYWVDTCTIRVGDCALWTRATDRDGYPQIGISGTQYRPHRLACYVNNGKPPSPLSRSCHSCDNPACIELAHLSWGDAQSNSDDMRARGRSVKGRTEAKGLRRPILVLTEAQLFGIRTSTKRLAMIAAEYDCSYKTVQKIRGCRRQTGLRRLREL